MFSEKGADDEEEDISVSQTENQLKEKKKKHKKHDGRKPSKRPSKIKHLDPVFIGEKRA